MGGSTTKGSGGRRRGTGTGGQDDGCPPKIKAVITGPAGGISPGAWLGVALDQAPPPPRVVLFDITTKTIVGSLTGIPNLDVLIRCLQDGVEYRAHVENVAGGRVDVTVIKQ
ncbi:MAG: hypothetical protein ACXW27_11995 [Allosphingosinicella sp.]